MLFPYGVAAPTQYVGPDALHALVGLDPRDDDPESAFVPVHTIATQLNVQAKTLRWWMRRDGLDGQFKVGDRYRIDEAGAQELLARYRRG
ncbi:MULTISPECIES: hypothetical protein [unclassified Agrococcus]|uniref:hypothetical protein n=1 Tax=unclassified Agrococcus TaxID=2615065 RepID=UPI0036171352